MKLLQLNPKTTKILNIVAVVLLVGILAWRVVVYLSKAREVDSAKVEMEEVAVVPDIDYVSVVDTVADPLSSALEGIKENADNVVFYTDDRYIWYGTKHDGAYSKHLSVYDAENDLTSDVSLNKTSDFSDDEMIVTDIAENDGRITVINEEMRNSNGWVEGTSVWTIDCNTREWYHVAGGISGAKFRDGGKEVVLQHAECTNPSEEITIDREYKTYDTAVNLELPAPSKADVSLIGRIFKQFVFDCNEENVTKYFTPNALRKLQEDYDYDCYEGPCYGFWVMGSGSYDSPIDAVSFVTSINPDKEGWYQVTYMDGGSFGVTRVKLSGGKVDDYKKIR